LFFVFLLPSNKLPSPHTHSSLSFALLRYQYLFLYFELHFNTPVREMSWPPGITVTEEITVLREPDPEGYAMYLESGSSENCRFKKERDSALTH